MNSTNKKRKVTQNDLRQLMLEKKRKLIETKKKIDSPLAKYLDDGTLTCIICNTIVKTEAIWNIHISSKFHRENLLLKKQSNKKPIIPVVSESSIKKCSEQVQCPVKLKGILKNKLEQPVQLQNNVSNNEELRTVSNSDYVSQMDVDIEPSSSKPTNSCELPEGFFDDPIMDAKARNVEYKDPIEEEWDRFQREIQEESSFSEQLVSEDQETSAIDKEIELIDEHMQLWSKVQILEEKLELVQKKTSKRKGTGTSSMQVNQNEDVDSSYGSDEDFDDGFNWRLKKME